MTAQFRSIVTCIVMLVMNLVVLLAAYTIFIKPDPPDDMITITASGKTEVTHGRYVVSGYLHFYETDGVLAMDKADGDMASIEAVITEVLGSHNLFDTAESFNNWGGEDCIKCGKRFSYTAERGFSVNCPNWETMVELQSKLEDKFPEHTFRANSMPIDENQSIGEAVTVAVENAKKQAEIVTGKEVSARTVRVVESKLTPEINYNFAKATVEVVFSFL